MQKITKFFIWVILVIYVLFVFRVSGYKGIISVVVFLALIEICLYLLINYFRKDFQWLITTADKTPTLSEEGLRKFFKSSFDPELGWVRKPNTQKDEPGKFGKTTYHIGQNGCRSNPGFESLPKIISCYGDSFVFARQVNDDHTWEWHLSELTKSNVMNFGVGNYGLDQALLRLKREFPKHKTTIVIMGVVPSTIVRILCLWKHYNEFGNTFGFKPMFHLKNDKLELIPNPIDCEEKFFHYQDYLPFVKKYDYFYERKFKREMIKFPYFISILAQPVRNFSLIYMLIKDRCFKSKQKQQKEEIYAEPMKVIMKMNLKLRYKLFTEDEYAVALMIKLLEDFVYFAKEQNFTPVFLLLPQKDDILFIREKGPYYDGFIDEIKKKMITIDLTGNLIVRNDLDDIYSDDNEYGGHFSQEGNKIVARFIFERLKNDIELTKINYENYL